MYTEYDSIRCDAHHLISRRKSISQYSAFRGPKCGALYIARK